MLRRCYNRRLDIAQVGDAHHQRLSCLVYATRLVTVCKPACHTCVENEASMLFCRRRPRRRAEHSRRLAKNLSRPPNLLVWEYLGAQAKASKHSARPTEPWLIRGISGPGGAGRGFQVRRRLQVATPQAGRRSRQSFDYEAGAPDSQGTWFRTLLRL